jgi:hypothetical protein
MLQEQMKEKCVPNDIGALVTPELEQYVSATTDNIFILGHQ